MKKAYWGFLAGTVFTAGLVMFEIWELTPRTLYTGTEYSTGAALDLRDC